MIASLLCGFAQLLAARFAFDGLKTKGMMRRCNFGTTTHYSFLDLFQMKTVNAFLDPSLCHSRISCPSYCCAFLTNTSSFFELCPWNLHMSWLAMVAGKKIGMNMIFDKHHSNSNLDLVPTQNIGTSLDWIVTTWGPLSTMSSLAGRISTQSCRKVLKGLMWS